MAEDRPSNFDELQEALHHRFGQIGLLQKALTHRSFVNENPSLHCGDNERLEFLGDAVLELCIRDMLMTRFPEYSEGQLSKMRSSLVNEKPLAELARRLHLGNCLLMGKGEESSGGREKPAILANAMEALLAAIYVDSGFERARHVIARLFSPLLEGRHATLYRDYKTALQEKSQTAFRIAPQYILKAEYGPEHDKTFEVSLSIGKFISAEGSGKSKKEAEQQAAKKALALIAEKNPGPEAYTN